MEKRGSLGGGETKIVVVVPVPEAPLHTVADLPRVSKQMWMNDSHGPLDLPPEEGILTIITWSYGGKDVSVKGSWDNWTSRGQARIIQSYWSSRLVSTSTHSLWTANGDIVLIFLPWPMRWVA
eukprot:TRINITY_DN10677_c0_g1_i4.p1 TRINITY_DN10677_c0_g1~~TRINITY_DN10677_c0_g1_i4.p1  ORF type:complete len:123 (-),score=23.17 TRINITY_DN10677_c0_g1_i4:346-714(-)